MSPATVSTVTAPEEICNCKVKFGSRPVVVTNNAKRQPRSLSITTAGVSLFSLWKMSSSSPPSWLKTTPLHIEEIARHHIPHTIYLPALNDNDERETPAPEKYDSPAQTSHPDSLGEEYRWQHLSQESGIYN